MLISLILYSLFRLLSTPHPLFSSCLETSRGIEEFIFWEKEVWMMRMRRKI